MRAMLIALVIVLGLLAPKGNAPARFANECSEFESYLSLADELIGQQLIDLLQDKDWLETLERSSRKASATEMSILALDAEEMQPFIDLLSVPGDALLDIEDSDIPPIAQDLHDTALNYYLMMPAMLRNVSTGGVFAAMIFVEDMEQAESDNVAAQRAIELACPELIAELENQSFSTTSGPFEDAMSGDVELVAEMAKSLDPSDFHGVAFTMLFFADEDEVHPNEELQTTPGKYDGISFNRRLVTAISNTLESTAAPNLDERFMGACERMTLAGV